MRIALFSSCVPFIQGGGRHIVDWLDIKLREHGYAVERVYLPSRDDPQLLLDQIAAFRCVDLTAADRVICLRPPAHVIDHPDKVVWFIHHQRLLYDLWDSDFRWFPDDAHHRALRARLRAIDTAALSEATTVFANSQIVASRLNRFNSVSSEVLYPPLLNPERFFHRGHNDEIVCVSRVEPPKRQHLLVEALAVTTMPVRLRLCGVGQTEGYTTRIQNLVDAHGLRDRVAFQNRWISDHEKAEILADCLATAYIPVDEDSYGYPTLESSHAAKPIISVSDSGGVLELLVDGSNGFVTEPTPHALAEAMDRLYMDRNGARRMGLAARERLTDLNISWDHVVARLTS